jgi:hypothetical protein
MELKKRPIFLSIFPLPFCSSQISVLSLSEPAFALHPAARIAHHRYGLILIRTGFRSASGSADRQMTAPEKDPKQN